MKTTLNLIVTTIALFFSIDPQICHGKEARVKVDKAKIYSDASLKTAIGFSYRGDLINIGDELQKSGKVASSIYQGKVVFFNRNDLFIPEEDLFNKDGEDGSRHFLEESPEKEFLITDIIKESSLSFDYRMVTLSDTMKRYYSYTNTKNGHMADMSVDYWWNSYLGNSFGGYYFFIHDKNMQYNSFGPSLAILLRFLELYPLNFNLSANIFYSPYSYADIGDYRFSGNGYGADLGTHMNFIFTPLWKLKIGGGYFYYRSNSLQHQLKVENSTTITRTLPDLKTASLYLLIGSTFSF